MKYVVTLDGRERIVTVEDLDDGRKRALLDGVPVTADLRPAGGGSLWSLLLDAKSCEVSVVEKEGGVRLWLRGRTFELAVESEQERNARALTKRDGPPKSLTIKASMPGIVTKAMVRAGDSVVKGQALLIVEAMKMENEIRAESDAIVAEVAVQPGKTVASGDVLVRLKP